MMGEVQQIFDASFVTLAMIAAGYLGYRLAYTGKDQMHGQIDVVFFVCVFAFASKLGGTALFWLGIKVGVSLGGIAQSLLGIVISLIAASLWRVWGERGVFRLLRILGVSYSKRYETAWQHVTCDESVEHSLMIVKKADGTELMSENMGRFNDLPFGASVQGEDGSVALYVTHRKHAPEDDWQEEDPSEHGDWGAAVTVVPASEILEVYLRSSRR